MKHFVFVILFASLLTGVGIESARAQGRTWKNIAYGPDSTEHMLDIYVPFESAAPPIVVFFHGGALREGDKEDGHVLAERLVPEGIGVVSANYRLSPAVRHPKHVEDAAAAVAWVIHHIGEYGGDAQNVFLSGHSAGGYLATLLVMDASYLSRAGVSADSIRGAMPLSPFLYVEETARDRPKDVWGTDPADWLKASVSPYIGAGKRPMLLIYADGDDAWRREQNDRFRRSMLAAGNLDVRAVMVPDRDHGTLLSEMTASDDGVGMLAQTFVMSHLLRQ
jgi:acetyl esterase/lipase